MLAVLVYVLTALAALVVVLTQVRLRRDPSGNSVISGRLLTVHTVVGALAWVLWVVFLVASDKTFLGGAALGIVALALWWITVFAGLSILARWLPSKGRHADEGSSDSWARGPGLSMLAHVGLLVAVLVFTYAYLTSAV